ncbi:hypothetical protein N9N67_03865, partial [Bacteriovoracaceae bacterium]|nr:hypothetical protein [Bacteriovoracaceae bacterium]
AYSSGDPLESFIIEFNSSLFQEFPKFILENTRSLDRKFSINHIQKFRECLDRISGGKCAVNPTKDQLTEFIGALAYILDNLEGIDPSVPFVDNIIKHIVAKQDLKSTTLPTENEVECVEESLITEEEKENFDSAGLISTLKKPIGIFVNGSFFRSEGYEKTFSEEEKNIIEKVRLYIDYYRKQKENIGIGVNPPPEPTYEEYVIFEKYSKQGGHAMAAVGDGQNCHRLGEYGKQEGEAKENCLLIQNSWGHDLQINPRRYPDYMIPYQKYVKKDGRTYNDYSRFWVCDSQKLGAHFSGYGFIKSKLSAKGNDILSGAGMDAELRRRFRNTKASSK